MMTKEEFNKMYEELIEIRARKNLKQSNESCNTMFLVSGRQVKTGLN